MSYDGNREKAFFATVDDRSANFSVQVASGTLAYIDVPPGEYACFAPAGAAGEHFRWAYLPMPDISNKPTLANAAAFPAPTPATSAQVSGVPATARGAGMAPANALEVRISIRPDFRTVILYSAAGPINLYCTRVSGA